MSILFCDVETTGLLYNDIPRHDPRQPHIAQWACLMTDNDFNDVASFSVYIKPDGWSMPEETTKHNNISHEMLELFGVDIRVPRLMFDHMSYAADEIIVFNKGFDDELIKTEYLRQGKEHYLADAKVKCAMSPCTCILKLPNPREFAGYKWAKLTEAYRYFYTVDYVDAHDAAADVRATRDVWRKLRDGGHV